MENKRTIFITCFFNLVGRNILSTKFFELLKSSDKFKIVLLVPSDKETLYKHNFGADNVVIEPIFIKKIGTVNLFFHWIFWNLLDTESKKIHRVVQLNKDKNIFSFLLKTFISKIGHLKIFVSFLRRLDYKIVPGGGYDQLFNLYKPSIVFSTDPQDLRLHELGDSYLLREAKRHNIATFAMSRSWDSITTKGILRTLPDILIVQNMNIKKQAIKYHFIYSDKIRVVGIPHYDNYISGKRSDREIFFKKMGFDSNKKLVLFVPPSDIWTGDKTLNKHLLNGLSKTGEQIMVRFPIFGGLDLGDFKSEGKLFFDMQNNSEKLEESFMNKEDDNHLADSLYHCDVVVTGPSSLMLDAAVFDKPIVLIGYDGGDSGYKKPYWKRLSRYYDYEHQKDFLNSGFAKIAKNPEELILFVKDYLNNPKTDSSARKIVAMDISSLDGNSGARLFSVFVNLLLNRLCRIKK
ncbi:MAG: CDP-glycerol glycerophosphotransferase family protein [Patescibacteria group bacterium]